MSLHHPIIIFESSFLEGMVILVVVIQRLTKKVQAVQVMQSFDVGRISTSVFLANLDL